MGTVKYSGTKTSLTEQGDVAEIPVTRYDQYGDIIKLDNTKLDSAVVDRMKADVIITPWSDDALKFEKADTEKKDVLKISMSKNIDKAGDYTATVYVGAASATTTIAVKSSKIATNVDFDTFTGSLAVGDKDKYIPIIAYDADGNKLSTEDIVENAKNKRFSISVSGATIPTGALGNGNDAIVQSGEHKGKIRLTEVTSAKGGSVYINLGIYTANVQVSKQQQYTVQDIRKAETIKLVSSEPKHKAVAGGESTVKWEVRDQYGEKLDALDSNKGDFKLKVSFANVTDSTYVDISGVALGDIASDNFESFNGKEIKLTAKDPGASARKTKLVVQLFGKAADGTLTNELKKK